MYENIVQLLKIILLCSQTPPQKKWNQNTWLYFSHVYKNCIFLYAPQAYCQSEYVNSHRSHLETHSLLSSQRGSKSHCPYDAFMPTCQWCTALYTCTAAPHRGACCASIFTARNSEKPNESPVYSYLPALSCSVLSSLFSPSIVALPHTHNTVCLFKSTLPLWHSGGAPSFVHHTYPCEILQEVNVPRDAQRRRS